MTTNAEKVKIFHDSLDRACTSGKFMDIFYDGFISSSIDIEAIFKDADMSHLKRKLKSSLHMMTMLIDHTPGIEMYIGHLARVHDRYHIPPVYFTVWLDSLIAAVSRCDEKFDPQIEAVWRDVIGRGILIMQQGAKAKVVEGDDSAVSA